MSKRKVKPHPELMAVFWGDIEKIHRPRNVQAGFRTKQTICGARIPLSRTDLTVREALQHRGLGGWPSPCRTCFGRLLS